MKIHAFDDLYPMQLTQGGTLLIVADGSNAGTSGGDITGSSGDLSVIRLSSTVSLGSNLATGALLGDVLTIVQASPAVARFATPSNTGGASFGSNATRISETVSVGFSSNTSRADHIHDGIGTVTASSSNTLQRGTLNLRAGTGMALALTDSDGSGALDTVTFVNTAGGSTGGGSGAPTDATYVTTAASASLSAEIIIPGFAGLRDRLPTSPGASDDEFEALSGWTTLGSLTASNVTDYASHWHVTKNNAGQQIHGLYKAAPSTPFTVTCKIVDHGEAGNYSSMGLMIGDATPTAWYAFGITSYQAGLQESKWTNNTTRSTTSTSAVGEAWFNGKYLKMTVNSASSVDLWWSRDGHVWITAFTTKNPGFAASYVGLWITAEGVNAEASFDWIRFA